jgi:hypothetical protein
MEVGEVMGLRVEVRGHRAGGGERRGGGGQKDVVSGAALATQALTYALLDGRSRQKQQGRCLDACQSGDSRAGVFA